MFSLQLCPRTACLAVKTFDVCLVCPKKFVPLILSIHAAQLMIDTTVYHLCLCKQKYGLVWIPIASSWQAILANSDLNSTPTFGLVYYSGRRRQVLKWARLFVFLVVFWFANFALWRLIGSWPDDTSLLSHALFKADSIVGLICFH